MPPNSICLVIKCIALGVILVAQSNSANNKGAHNKVPKKYLS